MSTTTMTITGTGDLHTDEQVIEYDGVLVHNATLDDGTTCDYTGPALIVDRGYGVLHAECPACWTHVEVADQ